MREVILCKYGEIALKGANRRYFEDLLCRTLERRLSGFGSFSIAREQSTLMITPDNDSCDLEQAYAAVKKVFGIAAVSRSIMTEKSMESILAALKEMAPVRLNTCSTFKIDARRSDKRFPLTSPQICEICGGAVLEMMPELRVDVHRPDVVIRVEIRDTAAYLHAGQEKGAGGMPLGSNGRGLLLLSGGIDSPVAGCMMAKRGVLIEAVHFESFPYTSERARAKVIALAGENVGILWRYPLTYYIRHTDSGSAEALLRGGLLHPSAASLYDASGQYNCPGDGEFSSHNR